MEPIKLRTAQPHDKAAIANLASKIWEGEDYLAQNFNNWVKQEHGRFIVAYAGDRLVGCNKLTRFGAEEWWMEGLRVDPEWRGKGIARLLHENIIKIVEFGRLTGSLRLATDGENLPVHRLALNSGFHHISRHKLYKAAIKTAKSSKSDTPSPFEVVKTAEKATIEAWFEQSAHFEACHGLFEDNWKWYEIMPRLDDLLEDGRIYWWRSAEEGPEGVVIVHHRDKKTLVLNYCETTGDDWAGLLSDVRELGRSYKVGLMKSKPPATAEIESAFPDTGWEIDYDLEMWVFERPLG